MKNVLMTVVAAALVVPMLAGCGQDESEARVLPRISSTEQAAGKVVRLTAAGPIPRRLIAGPGDQITWQNESGTEQTVRLLDGTKPSGPVAPGGTYVHRFDTSGTYAYRLGKGKDIAGVVEINLPATPVAPPSRPGPVPS